MFNDDAFAPRVKMTPMLTDRPSYQALQAHYQQINQRHLRDLFAEDPGRGGRMHAEAAGLYLDYSKNRITDETLRLLGEPAQPPAWCRRASLFASACSSEMSDARARRS